MASSSVFSNTLQSLRKERKITQEQLATYLGVSSQAVSKWENGSYPEGDLLPRIADYFEVSIDYLYGKGSEGKTIEQAVFEYLQKCVEDDMSKYNNASNHPSFGNTARNLFWAIQTSPWANNKNYYQRPENLEGAKTASVIMDDAVYSYMGLNRNDDFYLFLQRPADCEGFENWITDNKKAAALFKFLADEDNISFLRYLFSLRNGEFASLDAISKGANISKGKAEKAIEYIRKELVSVQNNNGFMYQVTVVNKDGNDEMAYGVETNLGGLLMGLFKIAETFANPPSGYQMQIGSKSNSWVKRESK